MPSYADNPYVDAQGRTDAETYLMGCLDGSVVSGRRMKQLAEKMLPRIRDGYKQWRFDVDAATRPVEFIERFCKIPSGKLGQPFVMEPYQRCITELIFGFIDEDEHRQIQYALIEEARKNGKGVMLDEELPTPNGWRKMGDLHVGDVVFGQDGKPSTIVAESEIFDKPTYLITFEDGASFKVTDDHIWTVQTKQSRRHANNYRTYDTSQVSRRKYRDGGWFETTTQEMYDDEHFFHTRADGMGREYKYRIPMCLPVEYTEKELPIDPYSFGYWIGDGASAGAAITVDWNDLDEVIGNLEASGHICTVRKRCGDKAATVAIDVNTSAAPYSNAFTNALRSLGVLGNKHIPDIYLQASVAQRMELLRGLMDTDGYCSKAGQCEFVQKNEAIVDQLIELCSSLGIKATKRSKIARCNGKPAGVVYQVQFFTDKEHSCFRLKRKHDRLKDRLAPRMSCKSIVSIERIPNEPTKCIAIDNDSHLYLVGHQYTATHNSSWGAAIELYCLVADGEGSPQIYNAATSKGQASLAYGAVWRMVRQSPKLSKYLRKGTVVERAENGIICDGNMGYVIPLSKQSDHLDGLDVHMCLFDEMAAAEDRSVFDLIRQGTGAREQPLMLAITTQGFVRDNLWDHEREYAIKWLEGKIEDDRLLPALFELDDRSEIWDEAMWPKANPGLGTIKKVEYLRTQVIKAKNDPSYMPTLLTKDFNQPANQASAWLDFESAVNTTLYTFDPKVFRYCILGFDAADTLDLNAATALFMKPGDNHLYRRSMYWIAEEQVKINSNNQRGRDGVPYQEWADRGLIRIVPGNNVDRRVFLDWVQELADEGLYTRYIGLDPWGFKPYLPDLRMMVGDDNVEEVRQGAITLSLPMKQLRADMRDGRIINNHNPIDEWCNLNVSARIDRNENVTPVKKSGATTRIDGFMALLDAYVTFLRHEADYKTMIGWHD